MNLVTSYYICISDTSKCILVFFLTIAKMVKNYQCWKIFKHQPTKRKQYHCVDDSTSIKIHFTGKEVHHGIPDMLHLCGRCVNSNNSVLITEVVQEVLY